MSHTLTIRNLDDGLKTRLRLQAAQHGHSMEQEVRDILARALQPAADAGLAQRIRARFAGLHADDLSIPARRLARLPDAQQKPDAGRDQLMAPAVHAPAPPPSPAQPAAAAAAGVRPSPSRRRR